MERRRPHHYIIPSLEGKLAAEKAARKAAEAEAARLKKKNKVKSAEAKIPKPKGSCSHKFSLAQAMKLAPPKNVTWPRAVQAKKKRDYLDYLVCVTVSAL